MKRTWGNRRRRLTAMVVAVAAIAAAPALHRLADGFTRCGRAAQLQVRRARETGDGWVLAADNPAWNTVAWPADTQIVGRVVWAARMLV